MRAAVMQGKGRPLAIAQLVEHIPGPDQLLLGVRACGICGSDLHLADSADRPGFVLGHELSGEVAGIGTEVEGWRAGDRVTVLERVGVPGLIQHAFEVVASDGHMTVVGMCIQPDQIRPTTAMQKELSVEFVLFYRRQDFELTSKLHRGDIDPEPLITDAIGLNLLPERFEALKRPTTECKVLIEP